MKLSKKLLIIGCIILVFYILAFWWTMSVARIE